MAEPLERLPGTALRILATNDLGAAYLPVKTSWGALVGARRWHDVAALPIAAAAAGNHDFDDGLPHDGAIDTRPDRLARVTRAWAGSVDLGLGGHTLGAWCGTLGAPPAGHAHPFASTVLVADLPEPPERPVVRGRERVDGVRPARDGAATDALAAAAGQVVGESRHSWVTRTGAEHYLPDLVAAALCDAAGADAGLVPAFQHANQAPLDGAVAALAAGPVTELDLLRLFDYADDHSVVVELEPGELAAAARVHDATCDPRMRAADDGWWAWCRMPAAVSRRVEHPRTVAVMHRVVPRLAEWLGREPRFEPAPLGGRAALARALA